MQAVTAKGVTPASNSPTDIATAINTLDTSESHCFYGSGSGSNSWTTNIKRISNILKITGAGYYGNSANQTVKLMILGAPEECLIPFHVYNGSWLPTITTITISATSSTQEIDVSAYPRLVLYVQYGSATSSDSTRVHFLIEN